MLFVPRTLIRAVPNPRYVGFHGTAISALPSTTFSAAAVGPAHPNRRVYLCAFWKSAASRTLNTITVNGNAATIAVQHTSPVTFSGAAIACRALVNGDTADLYVELSGNVTRIGLAVLVSYGHSTSSTDTASASEAASNDVSVDVPLGGLVIGAASNGTTTATWTGITEKFDDVITGSARGSGGLYMPGPAATPLTVTMAPASGTDCAVVAASFARL